MILLIVGLVKSLISKFLYSLRFRKYLKKKKLRNLLDFFKMFFHVFSNFVCIFHACIDSFGEISLISPKIRLNLFRGWMNLNRDAFNLSQGWFGC